MIKTKAKQNMMIYILVINFSIVISAGDSAIIHNVQNNNFWQTSIECVNYLIKTVKCGSHITVVVPHTDIKFIPTYMCATFIVRTYDRNDWIINTDVYIIYRNNLDSSLWNIRFDEMWNPRAKFIVVVSQEIGKYRLKWMFDEFLQYNILDVVVLTNVNDSQVIFTYYPVGNGNCGNKYEKIVELSSCVIKNPLHTDYKDCSINVIAYKNVSSTERYIKLLEQYILNLVAKSNDIRLKYRSSKIDFGSVLPNYTSTGMLQLLQNKNADVMTGGFLLDNSRRSVLDFMFAHNYVSVKLLLPCRKQHIWNIIFNTFKSESWLIILNTYIFMVLVATATSYIFKIKTYQLNMKLLDNFFGHGNTLFKVKQLRFLLILWIWYTSLITNFYQSSLYSQLTTITHRTRLDDNNLSTLEREGYKPCLTSLLKRDYRTTYNITLPGKNTLRCHDAESVLKTMMTNDDYYTLVTEYDFYHYYLNDSKSEAKNIHPWNYSPYFVYVIYTTRGFYLRDLFQKRIRRIFESGLLQHHFRINFSNNTIKPITVHAATDRFYRVMNIADLRIPFMILFVGYTISFLIFAVEFIKIKA